MQRIFIYLSRTSRIDWNLNKTNKMTDPRANSLIIILDGKRHLRNVNGPLTLDFGGHFEQNVSRIYLGSVVNSVK